MNLEELNVRSQRILKDYGNINDPSWSKEHEGYRCPECGLVVKIIPLSFNISSIVTKGGAGCHFNCKCGYKVVWTEEEYNTRCLEYQNEIKPSIDMTSVCCGKTLKEVYDDTHSISYLRAKNDPLYFYKRYFPQYCTYNFPSWYTSKNGMFDYNIPNQAIHTGRGMGKSIYVFMEIIRRLALYSDYSILYSGYNRSSSRKMFSDIILELQHNKQLINDYPHLECYVIQENNVYLENNSQVSLYTINGKRDRSYNVIFYDRRNLHLGSSPKERESAQHFYYPTLIGDASDIEACFKYLNKNMRKPNFDKIDWLLEDIKSAWPDRYSVKDLLLLYTKIGEIAFRQNYM